MPEETTEGADAGPALRSPTDKVTWLIERTRPAGCGSCTNAEAADLIGRAMGERVSYTTIWKLRDGHVLAGLPAIGSPGGNRLAGAGSVLADEVIADRVSAWLVGEDTARLAFVAVTHRYRRMHCLGLEQFQIADYLTAPRHRRFGGAESRSAGSVLVLPLIA